MKKVVLILPPVIVLTAAALHVASGWIEEPLRVESRDIRSNPMSREVKAVLVEAFGPDALNIVVGVEDNVAVLSGNVSERSTQKLAESVAESVDGIIVVHNFLEAASTAASDSGALWASDARLKTRVSRALASNIGTTVPPVSVDACDGVVLLRGAMPDIRRHDTAITVTESLSGVSRVIDLVHVAWTTSIQGAVRASFSEETMLPSGDEK